MIQSIKIKDRTAKKLPRQKPRTCVACRSEAPKRALLRIVRKPDSSGIDSAIVDPTGKLPGRGAYICANPECLEKARKTGALARALKLKSLPDECYENLGRCIKEYAAKFGMSQNPTPEQETVRERELRSLLGLSRRAGLIKIGTDAIDSEAKSRHAVLHHEALLILTAKDCSEAVTRFAENLTGNNKGHEHFMLPFTIEELSAALGSGKVQIIALPSKGGLADKIKILIA